jgi:hypothetical protein
LFGFFSRSALESHFFVRKDGTIEQYIPLSHTADANYRANGHAVSVETEDDGNPDRTAWTPAQLDSMAEIARFLNEHYELPLRRTKNTLDSGIGGHTSHGSPSRWTPSVKSCPGVKRKTQIDEVVRLAKGGDPKKPLKLECVLFRGIDDAENVKLLQQALRVMFGLDIAVDGDFGPATEKAVKTVQAKFGLVVDGIYGPQVKTQLKLFQTWVAEVKIPA